MFLVILGYYEVLNTQIEIEAVNGNLLLGKVFQGERIT